MSDPLGARLRRLERQIRAFRDLHVHEVTAAAERLSAIAKLQADELALILDELADLAADVEAAAPTESAASAEGSQARLADPAASSPKRAKWLAEQERRAHLSRRELLGRAVRPQDEDA